MLSSLLLPSFEESSKSKFMGKLVPPVALRRYIDKGSPHWKIIGDKQETTARDAVGGEQDVHEWFLVSGMTLSGRRWVRMLVILHKTLWRTQPLLPSPPVQMRQVCTVPSCLVRHPRQSHGKSSLSCRWMVKKRRIALIGWSTWQQLAGSSGLPLVAKYSLSLLQVKGASPTAWKIG